MTQLGPVQFDLPKLRLHSWREILAQESVKNALTRIQKQWMQIAEFKYEETAPHDEEMAREELMLDAHIGQVKVKDLYWLCETFENCDLADLSLAIAQWAMPEKTWEIIEQDEQAIVTDVERSIVLDMKYGRELSAGASLVIAGDKKYQPTRAVLEEVNAWYEKRSAFTQGVIDRMRADLDRFNDSGVVLDLPLKTDQDPR